MDERVQIWNILHDGEITAVSDVDGETLTMFVSIPYLRRRLEPLGDSFILTLSGLSRVEFRTFDGAPSSLREALEMGSPELLSTDSESMPVAISTTMGQLTLDFKRIWFALDTGQSIDYDAISRVCEEYWTEWDLKAEQAAAERRGKPSA
jgi:hypothetical protein